MLVNKLASQKPTKIFASVYIVFSVPWFKDAHTFRKSMNTKVNQSVIRGWSRGVMVKELSCGIVERKFELKSRYYVHFRTNTLGEWYKPS